MDVIAAIIAVSADFPNNEMSQEVLLAGLSDLYYLKSQLSIEFKYSGTPRVP